MTQITMDAAHTNKAAEAHLQHMREPLPQHVGAGAEPPRSKSGSKKQSQSTAGKSTKKDRIARPMNSFMVFAQEYRAQLRSSHPELDNKVISKMLGQKWRNLSDSERQRYIDQAAQIAEQHKRDHPDWKFVRAPPRKKSKAPKVEAGGDAVADVRRGHETAGDGGGAGGGHAAVGAFGHGVNPIAAACAAAAVAATGAAMPFTDAARLLFGTSSAAMLMQQQLQQHGGFAPPPPPPSHHGFADGSGHDGHEPTHAHRLPPPSYVAPPSLDHTHAPTSSRSEFP